MREGLKCIDLAFGDCVMYRATRLLQTRRNHRLAKATKESKVVYHLELSFEELATIVVALDFPSSKIREHAEYLGIDPQMLASDGDLYGELRDLYFGCGDDHQ